jgi:hypothetical protein
MSTPIDHDRDAALREPGRLYSHQAGSSPRVAASSICKEAGSRWATFDPEFVWADPREVTR